MTTPVQLTMSINAPLLREGIKNRWQKNPLLGITIHSAERDHLIESIGASKPDVLIIDIWEADSQQLKYMKEICSAMPDTAVLLITVTGNNDTNRKWLQTGIKGLMHVETDEGPLTEAIYELLRGRHYCCKRTAANYMDLLTGKTTMSGEQIIRWTDIETRVLQLICEGLTSKEIAQKVFRSPRTIESIRKKIMQKTGTHNVAGIITYAFHNNLIPHPPSPPLIPSFNLLNF